MLAFLYWNPDRIAWTVPYIERPIAWYGVLFVAGFLISYLLFCSLLKKKLPKDEVQTVADRLLWYVMLGTVIGARLGHVFFYAWPDYRERPQDIIKVWEGGLSSHGAAIGIIIALFIASRQIKQCQTLELFDYVALFTPLVGGFVRIGNFINQEILGLPSTLPWAVIFGSPADGSYPIPRHPVQLYEAICYLTTFFIVYYTYKKTTFPAGFTTGVTLLLITSARFFFEFFKMPMSDVINESHLLAGQILTIPFFFLGIFLIRRSLRLEKKREIS